MKSKKILIVTECFYPEEFKINDLALSWKNKGYEVDILTFDGIEKFIFIILIKSKKGFNKTIH